MAAKKKDRFHPEYLRMISTWVFWRLVYEGGKPFIEACLKKYSRRESDPDFRERLDLAFNPAHTTKGVNQYRNALLAGMHEIKREGDLVYLNACKTNIDLKNNSMTAFMGLHILPLLMTQQKRYVLVDNDTESGEGQTKDEEKGHPYCCPISVEDIINWSWLNGKLQAVKIHEFDDILNEDQMVIGSSEQWRYMRMIRDQDNFKPIGDNNFKPVTGPGCLVRILNVKDEDIKQPTVLKLTRIPLICGEIVDSLVKDVANYQRAMLQLNSTDMTFLFRGNFTVFTKQRDTSRMDLKPSGKNVPIPQNLTTAEQLALQADPQQKKFEMGQGTGVSYEKGMERPGFVAPPTGNLEASMKKQDYMKQDINELMDLALTSMATKVISQSGESKKADRVNLNTGLSYIGSVLETMEREIAEVFHEFLGTPATKITVTYPKSYSLRTLDERIAEVKSISEVADTIYDEGAQREVHKLMAEVLLSPTTDSDTMYKIKTAIDTKPWFDLNSPRALAIQGDVMNHLGSSEGAMTRRGFPKDEITKAQAEAKAQVDALSGGPEAQPKPGEGGDPNVDPNNADTKPPIDNPKDGQGKQVLPKVPGNSSPFGKKRFAK